MTAVAGKIEPREDQLLAEAGLHHGTNGVLAHRVIERAVAGTDVAVTYVSRLFLRTVGQLARPADEESGKSGPA